MEFPSVLKDSSIDQENPQKLFQGCGNLEFSRDTFSRVKGTYELVQTVMKVEGGKKTQFFTVGNATHLPTGGVGNVPLSRADGVNSIKNYFPVAQDASIQLLPLR